MHDTERTLYLLCGIPYSGKSTLAKKDPVLSKLPCLSSDAIILAKAEQQDTTYDQIFFESIKDAEKTFRNQITAHFEAGRSFIIDRTNGNPKVRRNFCKQAKEYSYRAVCIYFEPPSDEEIKKRIAIRKNQSLSLQRVRAFKNSFVMPTLDEGFDAYFVVSNSQGS